MKASFPTGGPSTSDVGSTKVLISLGIPTLAWSRDDASLSRMTDNLNRREHEALTILLQAMSESFR
jgi:hypothetical protein